MADDNSDATASKQSTILTAVAVIRDTGTPMGRGVFALRRYKAGETVEVCEVEIIRMPYAELSEDLKHRVFDWGYLAKGAGERIYGVHALARGNGGIYNDNNPSNMRYEVVPGSDLLRFIAVRDIEIDEELTINYSAIGGGHTSDGDTWFKKRNIQPIRR
jgi:hypothetical protein